MSVLYRVTCVEQSTIQSSMLHTPVVNIISSSTRDNLLRDSSKDIGRRRPKITQDNSAPGRCPHLDSVLRTIGCGLLLVIGVL